MEVQQAILEAHPSLNYLNSRLKTAITIPMSPPTVIQRKKSGFAERKKPPHHSTTSISDSKNNGVLLCTMLEILYNLVLF